MRYRYRLIVLMISGLMIVAMIFINNASHEKNKEIYTKQVGEMAIQLKKDYLKDTVNNLILELETLKGGGFLEIGLLVGLWRRGRRCLGDFS